MCVCVGKQIRCFSKYLFKIDGEFWQCGCFEDDLNYANVLFLKFGDFIFTKLVDHPTAAFFIRQHKCVSPFPALGNGNFIPSSNRYKWINFTFE